MKKYFFILTYWLGGGTEKVFENIAKVLSENNLVYLFVINGFDKEKYTLGTNVKLLENKRMLLKNITENSVIVNFSGDWKSSLASAFLSKKFISWIHCNPHTMHGARTGFFNFWLLKHSERIVCVCNEQKEILQNEFGFKNDFTVIYNSVDFDSVSEKANENFNVNYKYFLMVARIDFNSKDFFTVIDAYSMLNKDIQSSYKLVFLGDGNDRSKVEEYVKEKKLSENIIFPGFDKNPYKWFKNAECNILSSRTEGFSLSVIEGMSVGCPEIITNYKTGAKEVADNGKNAIIVNIGNALELSNAMNSIITNMKLRNDLISNSFTFIKDFSQEVFSRKIKTFFGDV